MIQNSLINEAVNRILAISWRQDESHISSNVALLKEYLRRIALWSKALDCVGEWPFFDVAAQVCPETRVDEDQIGSLRNYLNQRYPFSPISWTCIWFVQWTAIKNMPKVKKLNLPEPYEPLIVMYERGGSFYREHQFFHVSTGSFPTGTWEQHYQESPVVELDEKILNQIDMSL